MLRKRWRTGTGVPLSWFCHLHCVRRILPAKPKPACPCVVRVPWQAGLVPAGGAAMCCVPFPVESAFGGPAGLARQGGVAAL